MPDEGFSIGIEGLSELQTKLNDLGTKAAERAIRKALRAGAEIEQAAISERAPVKVGTGGLLPNGALKNDIVVRMKRDDQGSLVAIVTPDKYTAHVARWVEYGHRMVTGGYSRLLPDGRTRGPGKAADEDVPEHPFIRPAFEATEQEVAAVMTTTLIEEIEKEASRKGTNA
ncbi:HK97-gp10 family putative phage morphogenesis protein [Granulicella sp. dw_53]|uniref:HK97-gp10 family putative phage morphogenesis protein n=1 Tax=Granulicella sp. dw_53 TaxID=2719792 RepID=UPI001BD60368|nr:HK97-gp10 family putative phage morphogenesis protein [Granulicella sp. dw_53]